jgi:hypothetical protein
MKFARRVTKIIRDKSMRIEKIVVIAPGIFDAEKPFRCDGCDVVLKDALPWACVWAVRLKDNVGGGYRLCVKCTEDARLEIADTDDNNLAKEVSS